MLSRRSQRCTVVTSRLKCVAIFFQESSRPFSPAFSGGRSPSARVSFMGVHPLQVDADLCCACNFHICCLAPGGTMGTQHPCPRVIVSRLATSTVKHGIRPHNTAFSLSPFDGTG